MPSLIDEMTPRSRVSERCTACSTFERCTIRSTTSASTCMTHRTADDADQRAGRQRRDGRQLGLGALLLPLLDGAERLPDALEGRTALRQVAVDGFGRLAFEDRRDHLVAARQVVGPRAVEAPCSEPPALVGVAGRREARA